MQEEALSHGARRDQEELKLIREMVSADIRALARSSARREKWGLLPEALVISLSIAGTLLIVKAAMLIF